MKRLLPLLLATSPLHAVELSDFDYKLFGCHYAECNIEIAEGNLEEFGYMEAAKGKGGGGLKSGIRSATGLAGDAVAATVDGLRSTALAAGFTTLKAELSGPNGSCTFTMNLGSGRWTMNSKLWGGGKNKPKPRLAPTE